MKTVHELKCLPEFFQPTLRGIKRFELRRDDREGGFQVGDELLLKEWDPTLRPPLSNEPWGMYTGREVLVRVDYVMPTEDLERLGVLRHPNDPLRDDYIIMSVSLI